MQTPPSAKPAHHREPILWPLRLDGEGPRTWKPHSALQRAEASMAASFDPGAGEGKAALRVGGDENHWPAVGCLLAEWTSRGELSLLWVNQAKTFRLLQRREEPSAEPRELKLSLFDEPRWHWRLELAGREIGAGDYAEALPFRPYAAMTDEIRFEAEGSARLGEVRGRVGARRALVVALGDSQIHQARVSDALIERGAPRMIVSGRAGGTAKGCLARLESDVLAFAPKRLLLWAGSNDLRAAEAQGKPAREGIASALESVEKIVSACRERGIACCAIGGMPRGEPAILEWNERLGELLSRQGADFYDPYEVLLRRNDKMDIRLSDGLHPNDAGAEKVAEWLAGRGLVEKLSA